MAQTDRDMIVLKNTNFAKYQYEQWPFRSSFSITSGVYYYEVIPVTGRWMRFGWATREAKLTYSDKIGDYKHSIGLELGNEFYIYYEHGKIETHQIQIESSRSSPNVIGCLIDTSNRQFRFYLNGHQVKSPDNVHFSTWPYYATVSLGKGLQCQLNFGQAPFKFAPKDIRFDDFGGTSEDVGRFQLAKTVEYGMYFWFAHPVIANQVSQFYCDPEQVKCDELVRQLEHIEHNQTTRLDHSVEGGRLVQSVIEVMQRKLTWDHNDRVGRLLREVIEEMEDNDFEKAKLLELLYPYYQMSTTSNNFIKCHNISTILILTLYSFGNSFIRHLVNNFSNLDMFLSKHCSIETFQLFFNQKLFITDPFKMIDILKCIESFPLPQTKRLLEHSSTLNWCCELFGEVSSVSRLYEPSCDLVRLQVGMCARWFRDHVMQTRQRHFPSQSTLNPQDRTKHIKLSSDCLSARNDYYDRDYGRQSVRTVCSVSSDIFYYEAVLITDGDMRIGWATKQSWLNRHGFGWDKYSIGFGGSLPQKIKHQNCNFYDTSLISNFTSKAWSVGDVVGCLIDCDKKIFRFYLNGKLVKCREKINNKYGAERSLHFSPQPYHAAVSLSPHQQVYLNLGQCPFRHAPSVPFRTFHQLSPSPPPPPLHSPRLSECYSLVQVLAKDRVELVFDDDKQKEFDQLTKQIEQSKFNYENVISQTSLGRLRLLQSFISVSGPTLPDSCLSVHANFLSHLLSQSTSANTAFPDLVAQLLYPYFTLHLTNHTAITHRNVAIVLSSLIPIIEDFPLRSNLYQQLLTYFTQIITNSNQVEDEFLLIFALICLENMDLSETNKESIKANSKFCKILEAQSYSTYHIQLDQYNTSKFVLHQSEFCTRWFLEHVLNSTQPSPNSTSQATLNPLARSPHLKLSPSLLTARSDRLWQSVRSICSATKVVYYEVTLHTSGPMRIGWTNKRCNVSAQPIGTDDSSIGFDGHSKCVWHENRPIKLLKANGPVARWKAGDIVGCLIDVERHSFSFYLNRQLVYVHSLGFFSKLHQYNAAVSLYTHQQCHFNFGPTALPPPRTDFNTFHSILDLRGSVTNLTQTLGHSINNSIVLLKSQFNAGNVKVQNTSGTTRAQPAPSNNFTGAQIGNFVQNIAHSGDNNLSDFKIDYKEKENN